MISAAIRDFWQGSSELNDKLADRIYPQRIPQGSTGIAVVLTKITGNHEYHLTNELGITAYNYQCDVYGDSDTPPAEVEAVAELIRLRTSGYRGQLNAEAFCHGAFIDQDNEASERPQDASDRWPFRQSFNFEIHVTTAVPTH